MLEFLKTSPLIREKGRTAMNFKLICASIVGVGIGVAVAATTPAFQLRGDRFKPLTYEQMTPEQKTLTERVLAGDRGSMNVDRYPLPAEAKPELGPLLAQALKPGAAGFDSARNILAPTGKLRVGLYQGSPTSIVPGRTSAEAKGVGYDLGRELARYLDLPFEPVVFPKNADVFAAVKSGAVDVAFTNATPDRAREIAFSNSFIRLEQGCLVPAGSSIRGLDEIDVKGVRVGVSVGSTSEKMLANKFKNAQLLAIPTFDQVISLLKSGTLEAFATNKAILYELSDRLPGSKVLEGAWGYEHIAAGIPKGREGGLPLLNQFLSEAQQNGQVAKAVERAGLRGTAPADR